jgi:hypothetical protein
MTVHANKQEAEFSSTFDLQQCTSIYVLRKAQKSEKRKVVKDENKNAYFLRRETI